jgi:hypothetical protein
MVIKQKTKKYQKGGSRGSLRPSGVSPINTFEARLLDLQFEKAPIDPLPNNQLTNIKPKYKFPNLQEKYPDIFCDPKKQKNQQLKTDDDKIIYIILTVDIPKKIAQNSISNLIELLDILKELLQTKSDYFYKKKCPQLDRESSTKSSKDQDKIIQTWIDLYYRCKFDIIDEITKLKSALSTL